MVILKRLFSSGSDGEYEKGISAYNRYHYLEAIGHFDKVLSEKTSKSSLNRNLARFYCAQAHRNIGIIRFAAGNYAGSLNALSNAMKLNKEHVDLYYFIGICHNNLRNYEEAAKAFNNLLKIDPGHMPTQLKLAIAFNNLEMWAKSTSLYQDILKQNPDYADVHYHLGLALLGEGRARDAVGAFKAALSINPSYLEARVKYCIALTYLGELDEALEGLESLNEEYPDYPDLLYYIGIVHSCRNETRQAIDRLQQATRINPQYKDARIKLSLLYCREGKFSAALNELSAIQFHDVAEKDLESAKRVLRRVMAGASQSTDAILNKLASIVGGDKSIAEIIRGFNKSVDITLNFSEMVSLVEKHTSIDNETGLWKMLLPLALEHIQQHPDYADLYNTLGGLYLKQSRTGESVKAFTQAITINPNYLKARINLFNVLKQQNKYEEALFHGRYLTDAMKIKYPDIITGMGNIYLALSNYTESLKKAKVALEEKPDYPPAVLLSAQSLESLSRTDQAIETYRRLMRLTSDPSLAKQAEEALRRLKTNEK